MKTYTYEDTQDPNLFRLVDRYGDWTHYWHRTSDTYLRAVNHILDQGYAKPGLKQYFLNTTADQADKVLKKAGDKGAHVHRFIEKIFKGEAITRSSTVWDDELNEEVKPTIEEFDNLLAFKSFWIKHDPILIAYEVPVYNLKVGYAGTLDGIIQLTKSCDVKICDCGPLVNKAGLWDWKNSSGIRAEYGAQVASYSAGENLSKFLHGKKLQYTAIARLGTNHKTTGGYEIEAYDPKETQQHFKEFLSALTIANSEYRPFDPKKEIYDVEDEIKLTIKNHAAVQVQNRSKKGADKEAGPKPGKVVFHVPQGPR